MSKGKSKNSKSVNVKKEKNIKKTNNKKYKNNIMYILIAVVVLLIVIYLILNSTIFSAKSYSKKYAEAVATGDKVKDETAKSYIENVFTDSGATGTATIA